MITFSIVVLLILVILQQNFATIKGFIGEKRIQAIVNQLGEEYSVFHDLYVPTEQGHLTQIDHLILSPYGIFVIETKNYDGWIFGSEKQKMWTQVIYKKKSKFLNPIFQNYGHVKAIECYLERKDVHSVIVFSNAATFKFKEPFQSATVIQNAALKTTIQSYKQELIHSYTVKQLAKKIALLQPETKQEKKRLRQTHMQHIQTKKLEQPVTKNKAIRIKTENIQVEGMEVCPRCEAVLIKRTGKNGDFYGCSSFPKCRYTKQLKEKEKEKQNV